MENNLKNLTIVKARELLASHEITSEQLTQYYLHEINNRDKELNTFISYNDQALDEARVVDERIASSESVDFLEGVPASIKDVIVTRDIQTTAGSQILADYIPPYNSTVMRKLRKSGVVVLGKSNCDEFAMGSSNENSSYGPVLNPYDLTRVPGGSSGGSAAAVAADLCVYAIGTDTGGSIRQPASFCGVVGLKPTYGRVSRYGLIAMASSFDQAGPITKTVEDAAIVLQALAGEDKKDSTTIQRPVPNYVQDMKKGVAGMKVAVPKQFFNEGLSKEVGDRIKEQIEVLKKLGVTVDEIDLPILDQALAVYYIIMPAEVSANLAKFDGVRFGNPAPAEELWDVYKKTRGRNFGEEVKRRILMGTYVLSAGYYDAYYKKALKVQTVMKYELSKIYQKYDAILGPTTPTTAFKIGELTTDPLTMYLSDIYTVVANIIGSPAISIPVGKDSKGLPIGLQLMGDAFAESKILQLAWHIENYRE
ncbi:MAG: Asp-tRNA(Asn)/Glu-tRNA(Gln) amidotransferase subunit GatA [Candidatus Komeilibacteria bacterium]